MPQRTTTTTHPWSRSGRLLSVFALTLALSACQQLGVGVGPMTGTWTGTIHDSVLGEGTLQLDVEQGVCTWEYGLCGFLDSFRGTFTATFDTTMSAGSVYATWSGTGIELRLSPPYCQVTSHGTRSGHSAITTSYSTMLLCFAGEPSEGSITLVK